MKTGRGSRNLLLAALIALASIIHPAYTTPAAQPSETSASPQLSCNWTGTWDTTRGVMNLIMYQESGAIRAKGNFTADNGGSYSFLDGLIMGEAGLDFIGGWYEPPTYSSPDDGGAMSFEMNPNCTEFTGGWRYGSQGEIYPWNGTLIALPAAGEVNLTAQGPGVLVNDQPIPKDDIIPFEPGDSLELSYETARLSNETAKAEVGLTCAEGKILALAWLFIQVTDWFYEEEIDPLLQLETYAGFEGIIQKYCPKGLDLSQAALESPNLAFELQSGALEASVPLADLALAIRTGTATVHSAGANHFALAYNPAQGTTRVRCYNGTVEITPQNPALPSMTLKPGQQVEITTNEVGPVTRFGLVFLPVVQKMP